MKIKGILSRTKIKRALSSRFRSWVNSNIQQSIVLLHDHQNLFPNTNYSEHYLNVCWQLLESYTCPLVLHLGCGRDRAQLTTHRPEIRSVKFMGVDIDFNSLKNYPQNFRVQADLKALPFRTSTFDLAMSEEVFEHIEHPDAVISEAARVLKAGGKIAFSTPNKLGYISFISLLTPLSFHRWVQDLLNPDDPQGHFLYPTFYRLNSPMSINRIFHKYSFRQIRFELTEPWPWMLRIHPLLLKIGILWGLLIQRFKSLAWFRNRILGVYELIK